MKSNCCHSDIEECNNELVTHYICQGCNKYCEIVNKCIRCDKLTDDTQHSCTPTKQFRAGIVEGLRLGREEVIKGLFKEIICISDVAREIDQLIKQYSGEE